MLIDIGMIYRSVAPLEPGNFQELTSAFEQRKTRKFVPACMSEVVAIFEAMHPEQHAGEVVNMLNNGNCSDDVRNMALIFLDSCRHYVHKITLIYLKTNGTDGTCDHFNGEELYCLSEQYINPKRKTSTGRSSTQQSVTGTTLHSRKTAHCGNGMNLKITNNKFKQFGVNSPQFFSAFGVARRSARRALRRGACVPVSVMRHKGVTNFVVVKQVAHKHQPRRPTAAPPTPITPTPLFRLQEPSEPAEAEAAEQLSRKTLEEARELLGSSHQTTLMLISNLAVLLQNNKNHIDEAEELCREALHAQRKLLCTRHPDTLIAINNLAIVLMKNGKLGEAEALHREALEAKRDLHGTNHIDTLMSINNLAAVLLQDKCRLDDVELLFREALEAKRNMLGKKHPDTLKSLNNLVSVLIRDKNNGKLDEVERLFREALQAKRETLGARHPETITSINNLATMLQKNGHLDEAEPLFSEALDATRANAEFKAKEEAATAVASSLLADEEAEKAAEVSKKHNSTKKKQRQKKHKGRGYLTQPPQSHGAQAAGRRDGDGEEDTEEDAARHTTYREARSSCAAEKEEEEEEEATVEREQHMAMARAAADNPPNVIEIHATELQTALDEIGAQGQVGEGGFGKVFATELPSLPGWGRVAIKLATSIDTDPSALLHEVQLLRKCSHPNVLPLLGFCGDRRAPCMITPLMRGGSLDDRLLPSPASSQRLMRLGFKGDPHLSWQQRLSALCDAARGLLHLHASSTLHRDVKTGNILLDGLLQPLQTAGGGTPTAVYRAFLSDVGLAKVHEAARTGGAAAMTHSTTSSVAFSTGFCDPTFINSNQHSKRTDAYGIGISLLMSLLDEPANGLLTKWEDGIADFAENDDTAKLDLLVDKASAAAAWPVPVTHGLARLVHGLSVVRNSMRLPLHDVLEEMEALLLQPAGGAANPPAPEPARVLTHEDSTESTGANIGNISHSGHSGHSSHSSGLTRLVGKLDRLAVDCGGDATLMRMQKHVNAAFISMMMRLEAKYTEHGNAPLAGHLSELEKINTLAPRHTCQKLNGHAHTLRIWWNAAKHDRGGWANPPSDQEAEDVTQGIMSELARLRL